MESNLLDILGKLVTNDFILAATLFERNTLAQNIELVKKVSVRREFEEKQIENLFNKISNLKRTRNLFIHGIWGEPFELDNDLVIICQEAKLDYKEEFEHGLGVTQTWKSKKHNEFRLTYFKKLVDNVEEIILIQHNLREELEKYNFDSSF